MPYDTKTYDDDRELTSYVWRNYRNLITPLESIADKTIQSEIKAQHASPKWLACSVTVGAARMILPSSRY